MKISAKIDYACKALVELSLHWPNKEPLQVQTIAKNQEIPIKFLIQILLHLKQFEIIRSIRGKKGGYLLEKAPKDIKLSDVIAYFDNSHLMVLENEEGYNNLDVMNVIWQDIDKVIADKLDSINFEMICDQKRKLDDTVMYVI